MINPSNPPAPLAKIDWYSFTTPLSSPVEGCGSDSLEVINRALRTVLPPDIDLLDSDGTWSLAEAKGFYAFRATHRASRIAVSWGTINAHVFVELAGRSCDWLRNAGLFSALVQATYLRTSRIDAAIDLHTSTTPETFVNAGHAIRFAENLGNIKSTTGDTFYVGSRKSDRSARVYRYADPHPRSHLLRIEAEYKGKAAKALAQILADDGEVAAVRAAHAIFAWGSQELIAGFLQFRPLSLEQVTSPATGNIAGLWQRYSPLSSGIMLRDWLTLDDGWKRWYCRALKRRLHPTTD